MLGVIRFFLATCVIAFHLSGRIPHLGLLAVNFFFVISGYLITLILHKTYHFDFKRFALNRALRLYPTYYFFALISVLLFFIPINGATSLGFYGAWNGEYKAGDMLGNIFIFPFSFMNDISVKSLPFDWVLSISEVRFRWISTSWSVGVELTCYLILFLFSARNALCSTISLAVSLAFITYISLSNKDILFIYSSFISPLLPFSLGAIGFFASEKIEINKFIKLTNLKKQTAACVSLIVLFLFNWAWAVSYQGGNLFTSPPFFLNSIIAMLAVMLFHKTKLNGFSGKLTSTLGDLSYPIFLCHFIIAYLVWTLSGRPESIWSWKMFFTGYPLSILLGFICLILIEKPIRTLRDKVRGY